MNDGLRQRHPVSALRREALQRRHGIANDEKTGPRAVPCLQRAASRRAAHGTTGDGEAETRT